LDKFAVYCLINNDQKDEAQLVLDLLTERGFKDKFFEDKINLTENPEVFIWGVVTYTIHALQ